MARRLASIDVDWRRLASVTDAFRAVGARQTPVILIGCRPVAATGLPPGHLHK